MREDCQALVDIMSGVTKAPPVMWGTSRPREGARPVSHSGSCIYVKRLSDLHLPTLKKLVKRRSRT